MSELTESLSGQLEGGLDRFSWPGQPDWLDPLRQQGLAQFRAQGLPTKTVERWKYTPLHTLEQRSPKGFMAAGIEPGAAMPAPLIDCATRVTMQDGLCAEVNGQPAKGLSVLSLEQALATPGLRLQEVLQSLEIADRAAGFAALNTATLRHGLVLHVQAGCDAGRLLLQWASAPGAEAFMANARVCILLEAGARLELVEQFESASPVAGQLNLVTQVQLDEGACLQHARLQQESGQGILITQCEVDQAAASEYRYVGMDFGGALVRHDIRSRLQAAGASCSLNGASLTLGQSHVDNHIDAEHLAVDCSSSQLFRAVLGDRSRVVFNGRVYVAPGADGTEAQQSSAGLLLSPLAEIDSKPELEIYADEVVASHGATVGQLDEDQLFYLRTRGLDRAAARSMMTVAFCRAVIDLLTEEDLHTALEARLMTGLEAAGLASESHE